MLFLRRNHLGMVNFGLDVFYHVVLNLPDIIFKDLRPFPVYICVSLRNEITEHFVLLPFEDLLGLVHVEGADEHLALVLRIF